MSKIRQLSIKGIRNFSDNQDNEIKFKCPITLILGENGTGKTTIIECLKYATTGDFPPNSDKGKSFVTDPCLGSAASVTRAAVKLEYEDKRETIMTIFRGLELRRNAAGTLSITSVDNTLSYIDKKSKKPVNMTNKCADTNAMLSEMLGVSKALLNYVIFCHQDDSFWPFDSGKHLKENLDEIFGTTKYNKALEQMRSMTKDYSANIKILKMAKDNAKERVNAFENKKKSLKNEQKRQAVVDAEIKKIDDEIQPIDDKLENISKSIENYNKHAKELNDLRMEYKIAENAVSCLRSNIEEIFEGSDEELKSKIDSFQMDFDRKLRNINEEKKKLNDGLNKEKELTKSLNDQKVMIGTFEQKMKDQSGRVKKRNENVVLAMKNWDMQCPEIEDEAHAKRLIKQLTEKLSTFENESEQDRKKRDRQEKLKQNEIDSLIEKRSAIQSEMNLKDEECTTTQSDLQKIRKEILNAGTAANRLKESELMLQEASDEYDRIQGRLDVNAVKKEIEDYTKEERENETEIASLNKLSVLESEIRLHQANHKTKMDQITAIREKHEDRLKTILDVDDIPAKKLLGLIDSAQLKLNNERERIRRDINSANQQVTSMETTLKHQEKDLERKLAEMEDNKSKLSVYCSYENYEDALQLQATKLNSLRDQKGLFTYEKIAYKKYLEKIDDSKACCPLCTRDFSNKNEIQEFKRKVKVKIDQNPDAAKSCEAELKKEEAKYDAMLQLKPLADRILEFEKYELKELKQSITETEEMLEEANEKLENLNKQILKPEEKLAMCDSVITDIALWDQCIDEIEKVNRKIEASRKSLQFKSKNTRTLQEIENEREACQEKIASCRENKERLQAEFEKYTSDKQRAWESKQSYQEKVLNIRGEMQKVNQLREKEKELNAKITSLNSSLETLREQFLLEDGNLSAANKNLEQFKVESRTKQKENQNIIERERRISFEISSYQKTIDEFIRQGVEEKLTELKESIEELELHLSVIKSENASLAKQLQKFESDFSAQERVKKDLIDNRELRKKQKDLNRLKQSFATMQANVKSMNYETLVSDQKELSKKKSALLESRHQTKGSRNEIDRTIKTLETELRHRDCAEAEKAFKKACTDLAMTHLIIDDLGVYMQGMDQAMTDYHKDRMNAVNEVMSRMWCAVYKGSDIKGIQIKTEATGKLDSLKRQFNYKLVQIKHGVEMEMRGRCSAGQRVLASIIIRIALAEAFCGDCGVLALDEPTTNLDVHNARSLAQALLKIVEVRSKNQKNFQLILITHDEEFLRVLAKLDGENSYYKLDRDERTGRTVISRQIAGQEVEPSSALRKDRLTKLKR